MGLSLLSSTAGELMEDLLDSGRGLEVVERDITREELGRSPADLDASGQIVLAVIRKGTAHRFDTEYDQQARVGRPPRRDQAQPHREVGRDARHHLRRARWPRGPRVDEGARSHARPRRGDRRRRRHRGEPRRPAAAAGAVPAARRRIRHPRARVLRDDQLRGRGDQPRPHRREGRGAARGRRLRAEGGRADRPDHERSHRRQPRRGGGAARGGVHGVEQPRHGGQPQRGRVAARPRWRIGHRHHGHPARPRPRRPGGRHGRQPGQARPLRGARGRGPHQLQRAGLRRGHDGRRPVDAAPASSSTTWVPPTSIAT